MLTNVTSIVKRILHRSQLVESLEIILSRHFPVYLSQLIIEYYKIGEPGKIFIEENSEIRSIFVFSEGRIIAGLSNGVLKSWCIDTNKYTSDISEKKFLKFIDLPNGNIGTVTGYGRVAVRNKDTLECKYSVWHIHNVHNLFIFQSESESESAINTFKDFHVWHSFYSLDGKYYKICTHSSPECSFVHCISSDLFIFNTPGDTSLTVGGKNNMILRGHTKKINCVVSIFPNMICSGSDDKSLIIWDITTGTQIATLLGHAGAITCLTVLQDGKICSGSDDHTLIIWNLNKYKCEYVLVGHNNPIRDVQVTTNNQIVSCSKNEIILWKLTKIQ